MPALDFGAAMRAVRPADPAAIPDVVHAMAAGLGAVDVVVYLADFGQSTLEPVPGRGPHSELPTSEPVATSMAGRVFTDQQPVTAERQDGFRVWVPIVEGSDRTGVLALTVPQLSDDVMLSCEELGLLTGYLIATQARFTDRYNVHRRRRSLSLAASMQWDLLPPLVLKTDRMTLAGALEPAYDVGGDCFDYALNDSVFDVAIFDPMGHGVEAALVAALAVGCYRHDRRENQSLEYLHAHLDSALASHFDRLVFATGLLARVNLDTGVMTWTNAGHPLPILIRGGTVVGELRCSPTAPWGLSTLDGAAPPMASDALEPGDCVLLYTDGAVEAHEPGGEQFGVERLIDLAGQHASDQLQPEEIVRRLVRSVLDHQNDKLPDDATLVLLQWNGPR
jgi:serine phosphatase RsbU (regulator of sigma subunit)